MQSFEEIERKEAAKGHALHVGALLVLGASLGVLGVCAAMHFDVEFNEGRWWLAVYGVAICLGLESIGATIVKDASERRAESERPILDVQMRRDQQERKDEMKREFDLGVGRGRYLRDAELIPSSTPRGPGVLGPGERVIWRSVDHGKKT
jgi:hypothetical protein